MGKIIILRKPLYLNRLPENFIDLKEVHFRGGHPTFTMGGHKMILKEGTCIFGSVYHPGTDTIYFKFGGIIWYNSFLCDEVIPLIKYYGKKYFIKRTHIPSKISPIQ